MKKNLLLGSIALIAALSGCGSVIVNINGSPVDDARKNISNKADVDYMTFNYKGNRYDFDSNIKVGDKAPGFPNFVPIIILKRHVSTKASPFSDATDDIYDFEEVPATDDEQSVSKDAQEPKPSNPQPETDTTTSNLPPEPATGAAEAIPTPTAGTTPVGP